jgi:hypothetical protein
VLDASRPALDHPDTAIKNESLFHGRASSEEFQKERESDGS